MIPACIFSYSGDALPLRECVRGAKLAGLLPVVCDDANAPIGRSQAAWIIANGGLYYQTEFERNGNLNGTKCAAGIARSLHAVMVETRARIAFKLDADTIILHPETFLGSSTGVCSTTMHRREAFGCCYTLTRKTARMVAMELSTLDDPTAPEDIAIWQSIKRLNLRHALHDFNPAGGAFSAVPKFYDPTDCQKFAACTFGNPPADGWRDRAMEVTIAMRRLNDFNLRLAQNQK